jgi:hypothetical protein
MRFDTEEGTVSFDLNGFDYGEAYRGKELREGSWYPTVDLGTGEDSVLVVKPPQKMIDKLAWSEAKALLSKGSLMSLINLQVILNISEQSKGDTKAYADQQKELLRIASLMMLKQKVPLEEVLVNFSKEYARYTDSTKDVHVKLLEQLYNTQKPSSEEEPTLKEAVALQRGLAQAERDFIQIEDQQEVLVEPTAEVEHQMEQETPRLPNLDDHEQ